MIPSDPMHLRPWYQRMLNLLYIFSILLSTTSFHWLCFTAKSFYSCALHKPATTFYKRALHIIVKALQITISYYKFILRRWECKLCGGAVFFTKFQKYSQKFTFTKTKCWILFLFIKKTSWNAMRCGGL